MRISSYARKYFKVSDQFLESLRDKAKPMVPGFDFDSFFQYIEHDDDKCIRGDIFKHPSAKKFYDLQLVDRPDKQTEEMFEANEQE